MAKIVRKPSRRDLVADFWRPTEQRLLVRRRWGWGWTVNVARLLRRG